ncbi:EAL domain-containing response regulator [Vibrio sp. Isolate24]|uniref:EAL domain-containing response regulator n=1 Tax=Vibrio sp. Isolate24 TaxID=2908534 RepID=UPI001EFDB52C|nr:EAL domain-containing response regulator [Vibrio sp. Isolate24]
MAHGKKITLIADDQKVVRHTLKLCLQNLDYQDVLEACDGKEAKQLAVEHDIDIIFCDLNMPVEDGFEVLRYLGEIHFSGSVILISGEEEEVLSSSSNLARLYKLDILGSLKKPISFTTVKDLMSQVEKSTISRINNRPPPVLSAASVQHFIDTGCVRAFFQPQIELETGRVCGLEVLARVVDEDDNIIPPDSFIPVAEKNLDFILSLTKTIVRAAFSDIAKHFQSLQDITFSLNISAKVLEDQGFTSWLDQVANEYQIPQENILCELTETALTHDQAAINTQLLRLRLLKFNLSIDDFGTGYSSIAQLHSIPFNELKVDKRFVLDCLTNTKSQAILEQSVRMGKAMGMSVVAEGVENREVEEFLVSIGCNIAQGYLYSKPDKLSYILAYMKRSNSIYEDRS